MNKLVLLSLLVASLAGCPEYELCVAVGRCPDVALVPTKPQPPPKPPEPQPNPPLSVEPNQSTEHVHCGPNKVFCWDSDGYCCKICYGPCS